MSDSKININDSNNTTLLYISNLRKEIDEWFRWIVNLWNNLTIWDSFVLWNRLTIWDSFKFLDNSIEIWEIKITREWMFYNWKLISRLDELKLTDDIYIDYNKISFWKDSYITKDEIMFKWKVINTNEIKYDSKIYINKNKVQFKDIVAN
jgi:hypothetical protein